MSTETPRQFPEDLGKDCSAPVPSLFVKGSHTSLHSVRLPGLIGLSISRAASSFNSQLDLISCVVIYIQASQQQSRSYKFASAALQWPGPLHHGLTLLLCPRTALPAAHLAGGVGMPCRKRMDDHRQVWLIGRCVFNGLQTFPQGSASSQPLGRPC